MRISLLVPAIGYFTITSTCSVVVPDGAVGACKENERVAVGSSTRSARNPLKSASCASPVKLKASVTD